MGNSTSNTMTGDTITTFLSKAKEGDLNEVTKLLKYVSVNAHDPEEGITGLTWSSFNGHIDVVQLLIRKGASLNLPDKKGRRAILAASFSGHLECCKLLIRSGCDFNCVDNDGEVPLIAAAVNGHADIVKVLIQNRVKLNIKNKNGCSALHLAADKGHNEVVRLLISAKAHLDELNNENATAIVLAAHNGHHLCVKMLQESGAAVNIQTNGGGFTALALASLNGHVASVSALLNGSANPNIVSLYKTTPLTYAVWKGHREVIEALIPKSNVDFTNEKGESVLHHSSREGQQDIVQLLLKAGASLNIKNMIGETALALSKQKNHGFIASMITKEGYWRARKNWVIFCSRCLKVNPEDIRMHNIQTSTNFRKAMDIFAIRRIIASYL